MILYFALDKDYTIGQKKKNHFVSKSKNYQFLGSNGSFVELSYYKYHKYESEKSMDSIWKNYKKSVLMLFSEFDDSTPAREVKLKVDNLKNINIKTILVTNGQHIGLETNSICKNDFSDLTKFHKDFFAEMKIWLKTL